MGMRGTPGAGIGPVGADPSLLDPSSLFLTFLLHYPLLVGVDEAPIRAGGKSGAGSGTAGAALF